MHWLSKDTLSEITIVCVRDHDYHEEDPQAQAAIILSRVQELLMALAEGTYAAAEQSAAELPVAETQAYRQASEKLQYIRVSAQGIRWSGLRTSLEDFRRGGSSAFDVTAFKNYLLLDVLTLLLAEGEADIYSFELRRPPTFGARDLMPALNQTDYIYRNLTDSKHVSAAMRRMVARSVTFRLVIAVTVLIAAPVILVQTFFPNSWVQSMLVGLGAAVSLASWLFAFRQRSRT